MRKLKIGLVSLGCPKNLVDSEIMLGVLSQKGYRLSEEIENSDVGIINTCSFIREAKEEAIDVILKACALKEAGRVKKIVVAGCLPQRYKNKLEQELPEVDAFIGPGAITNVDKIVAQLFADRHPLQACRSPVYFSRNHLPREFLTPRHFSYLRISDGCDNFCSYCVIPEIRGRYQSKPLNRILQEARDLVKRGTVEINLIGQDTTGYGKDLYSRPQFGLLLKKLTQALPKNIWVRILYTHPAHFNSEIISIIRESPNICKYVDLPLQHINNRILQRMKRKVTRAQILKLLNRIRKEIPGAAIRTTFIVGFPGETQKEFRELFDFVKVARFERLGVFAYSHEEGTPAYRFKRQVPEPVKQARLKAIMNLQKNIASRLNAGFKGKVIRVLIDEKCGDAKDTFLGRSEADAPEVDGCVFVKSKRKLLPGDFVEVKITDTYEYDLVGNEYTE